MKGSSSRSGSGMIAVRPGEGNWRSWRTRSGDEAQHPQATVDIAGDDQVPVHGHAPDHWARAEVRAHGPGGSIRRRHPGGDLAGRRRITDIQYAHAVGV